MASALSPITGLPGSILSGIGDATTGIFQDASSTVSSARSTSPSLTSGSSPTSSSIHPENSVSHRSGNVGPIAGGVVGGVFLIGTLVGVYLYVHRRRRQHQGSADAIKTSAAGEKIDLASDSEENQNLTSDIEGCATEPFTAQASYTGIDGGSRDISPTSPSGQPLLSHDAPPNGAVRTSADTKRLSGPTIPYSSSSKKEKSEKTSMKAAQRREELSRLMAEREESLAQLQQGRSQVSGGSTPPASGDAAAGTPPSGSEGTEPDLRQQIRQMQEEMERMRGQLSVLQDEPPPMYE